MKLRTLVIALAVAATPAVVTADRLTDKDLRQLVARIEDGRDRFDDALDDKIKDAVFRGESGEVDMEHFLNDFQASIDRVEERLTPEYSASTEAAALLRYGSAIERFFRQQPAGTKGESEWNRLAADLKIFAAAYGADFPLRDGDTVRRMGDREVASAADGVAKAIDKLEDALEDDLDGDNASASKSAREAVDRDLDDLAKDAKQLRDRVKDGKPSSAEAERVLTRAARIQSFIAGHRTPRAATEWRGVATDLETIAVAYRAPWPASR
ncbi:MAG TPA: hypothetical protein VFO19_05835 [Vicinamibacterales bacterium]|nr:hypothetical protein [Vicinamibacterales bacterium]